VSRHDEVLARLLPPQERGGEVESLECPERGRKRLGGTGEYGPLDSYRLNSTAFVVTQYFASMLAFSHFGRAAGAFR